MASQLFTKTHKSRESASMCADSDADFAFINQHLNNQIRDRELRSALPIAELTGVGNAERSSTPEDALDTPSGVCDSVVLRD